MKKVQNNEPAGGDESENTAEKTKQKVGRKRDHTRDEKILEAAIDMLAESSFDGMTMDSVAARAKASKATMYRRWSSKVELVRDALGWMNRSHLDLENLPDTGNLREDLLLLIKPQSMAEEERKFRVLAGLGSFLQHSEMSEAGAAGIFDDWADANLRLMKRAAARGKISEHADLELACRVITSTSAFRGLVERKPFEKAFYAALLDGLLLPALKNAAADSTGADN